MWEQEYEVPAGLKEKLKEISRIVRGPASSESSMSSPARSSLDSDSSGDEVQKHQWSETKEFVRLYADHFGLDSGANVGAEKACKVELDVTTTLQLLEDEATKVVQRVDSIMQHLSNIEITNIETSTTLQNLHFNCESLNNEFSRLSQIADRIQKPLQYFDDLVHISSTVEGQILSKRHRHADFDDERVYKLMHETGMRVRECIRFLEANSTFHDAQEYLTKYQAIERKLVGAMKDKVIAHFEAAVSRIRAESAAPHSSSATSSKPSPVAVELKSDKAQVVTSRKDVGHRQDNAALVTSTFYVKFLSYSSAAQPLIVNLERGAAFASFSKNTDGGSGTSDNSALRTKRFHDLPGSAQPNEINVYADALLDLHEYFCSLRLNLLAPHFKARLGDVIRLTGGINDGQRVHEAATPSPAQRDLLGMVGSSLLELDSFCDREVRHFYQHFRSASVNPRVLARRLRLTSTESNNVPVNSVCPSQIPFSVERNSSLWNMLHYLGDALYGALRAEIIKEADMFRLCGVIDMLLADPSAASSSSANDDNVPNTSSVQLSLQATRDAIKSKLLHDTQERLAYRAEAFVKSHIHPSSRANFRGQDEKYMELLDLRKSGKTLTSNQRSQRHPILQNACAFLGRLSRCVKPPLFQTLSQDCVKSCLLSLLDTAEAIDASLRDKHPLRAPLFALSHTMALREEISKFDIRCNVTRRTLNFSQTRSAFGQLLGAGTSLFKWGSGNAFVQLLRGGGPTVSEEEENIRDELESHLQTARQQFISRGTDAALRGLRAGEAGSGSALQLNTVQALESSILSDLEHIRAEVRVLLLWLLGQYRTKFNLMCP
eukprot:INCI10399.1.p1 GENE.INCI10399.1~~INCI10399.1.p1  ORF type:complete len:887 (-),score=138.78 INCI10399.1:529-3024(-)